MGNKDSLEALAETRYIVHWACEQTGGNSRLFDKESLAREFVAELVCMGKTYFISLCSGTALVCDHSDRPWFTDTKTLFTVQE